MLLRRVIEHFKKQEWTAIVLDFVIVVFGVFIGFQLTEWNAERHSNEREQQYLIRIASELDQTIDSIVDGINLTNERAELGLLLIKAITDSSLVDEDPERFIVALEKSAYTYSPYFRSQTFDEIKSAGDLNILRDQQLRFDLMEFYTNIRGYGQWSYLRELRQTEYVRRSAGILSYEQLQRVSAPQNTPPTQPDEAQAARTRMLKRPAFLEWLPIVADRNEDIRNYTQWLQMAVALRQRINANLNAAAD